MATHSIELSDGAIETIMQALQVRMQDAYDYYRICPVDEELDYAYILTSLDDAWLEFTGQGWISPAIRAELESIIEREDGE